MRRWRLAIPVVVILAAVVIWLLSREDARPIALEPAAPTQSGLTASPEAGLQFKDNLLARPVPLLGIVIDQISRAPVPAVDVLFRRKKGVGEASATSGADGRFAIELTPGGYDVRAMGDRVYAPAKLLMVGRVQQPLELVVEVARFATVRGRVVSFKGEAVADASVATNLPDRKYAKDDLAAEAKSGPDGRFEIGVWGGEVRLVADSGGVQGTALIQGVAPGAEVNDVEIRLTPTAGAAGVTRGPDGRGLEGVTVQAAVRMPGTPMRQVLTATSGPDGTFAFEDLMAGLVVVEAWRDGFGAAPPLSIRLAPDERRTGLALTLTAAAELAGRVVDAGGRPVAGATVTAMPAGSGRRSHVVSDARGTFRLSGLGAGPHALSAEADGFAAARLEQVTAPSEDLELVVQAPGQLRGRVTDANGRPVRDFTVAFERFLPPGATTPGPTPAPTRYVAEDGQYERAPVPPGTYDLLISAPGHAPAARAGVVVQPGQAGDGSIRLGEAGGVSGTVRAQGRPVAHAAVTLASGWAGAVVYTDDGGRFTVTGVAPGRRTLSVARAGYVTVNRSGIDVSEGRTAQVDVELTPARENGDGELYGIGAILGQGADGVAVTRIVAGGPSTGSRLRAGDVIRAIDGASTAGMSLSDVVERIRGENATMVHLTVERGGHEVNVQIVRARVGFKGDGANLAKCGNLIPQGGTPEGLFFLFS